MFYITFKKFSSARTGNILFQYLFSKVLAFKTGNHKYIPYEEYNDENVINHNIKEIIIDDTNSKYYFDNYQNMEILNSNIVLNGYFQNDIFYIPYREQLLNILYESNDYWYYNNKKEHIKDFIYSKPLHKLDNNDILVSLRLDDFIQFPAVSSDIIPPKYYINIIDNYCQCNKPFNRIFIVVDKIRHDWEKQYISFFSKWNPIVLQDSLIDDCALMRDSPILIHSNSTLCWFMSFLSKNKIMRIIPKTNFYKGQNLGKIENFDYLINIKPLSHNDVLNLNYIDYIKSTIYPLPYSVPDDYIIDYIDVKDKKENIVAELIPNVLNTYKFGPNNENEYKEMYRKARFGYTMKKGGWDCLRHYEILGNGCIPIFKDLDNCPDKTMISYPKNLIMEANKVLLPWNNSEEHIKLYNNYLNKILKYFKEHCTSEKIADYFFNKLNINLNKNTNNNKNIDKDKQLFKVLLIRCDEGVNYTRETLWIGIKNYLNNLNNDIKSIKNIAIEYPRIDYLYKDYKGDKTKLHGYGFTYTNYINEDNYTYNYTNEEIITKTKDKFWDLIIYGKIGPDEGIEGSFPNLPLWNDVYKNYSKEQIVFLYGGDECIDLTTDNRYKNHILYHGQFGKCFVRELKI